MRRWVEWGVAELNLDPAPLERLAGVSGAELVGLGIERFQALMEDCAGDILWEHIEILLRGRTLTCIQSVD